MDKNIEKKQKDHLFQPGQSGNPAGKKPGTRNKNSIFVQALLEGEAEELVRKIIELAKGGDLQALKICIDRLYPPLKAQSAPVQLQLPATESLADLAHVFLKATAEGQLSPDVAVQLVTAVGTLARIVEVDQLKERIAGLESAMIYNK